MTESTEKPMHPKGELGRPLVTSREVAAHLHISLWKLRKFATEGKLRVVAIGRGYLFDPRDIDDFIERSKVFLPQRSKHKK
jgi:excisionase family DNA binding protein